LADDVYTYNVTVVDYATNTNTTATRTITLDTTPPNVSLIAPANDTSSTTSAYNFTFNVTDVNDILNCTLILNDEIIHVLSRGVNFSINHTGGTNGMYNDSLSVGTHAWSVNCTDVAGNRDNSSSRSLTVRAAGGGGGDGYANFRPFAHQLAAGYRKIMYKNWKISFKVGDNSHAFKVQEINDNNVKISVSSETQEATLSVGEEKKFDVSGDNYYDLSVKLNAINSVVSGSPNADFTIKTIHEDMSVLQETQEPQEEITEEEQVTKPKEEADKTVPEGAEKVPEVTDSKSNLVFTVIVVIVVVVILIVALTSFRKARARRVRSKKPVKNPKRAKK
jgi:hypothetical protein